MKMKKTQGIASKALLSVAGFAAFGLTLTPPSAEAVPAFARQMGMQCSMCHGSGFPVLNSFGRAFKASGYTMTGAQSQIKGNGIAIPSTLNISHISKLRYQESAGFTNGGKVVWPDEQALLIGGKVADGIGALVEWASGEGSLGYKLAFEAAKMGNTRVSIIPFSTDALGAGYAMELMNTGAQRSQRAIEERKSYSATNVVGIGSGAATGIAVAITDPSYFVNITQFTPGFGDANMGAKLTDLSTYLRAAAFVPVAGMEAGFGIQAITGETVAAAGKTEGYVVDAQLEGKVGGRNLAVYASYGSAKGGTVDGDLITGIEFAHDSLAGHGTIVTDDSAKTTTNFGVVLGLTDTVSGYVAARSSKDFGDQNTVGLSWMMRQNMKFELYHTDPNDKDATTTLQMFTGW